MLFLLPLKLNTHIKEYLLEFGPEDAELITFSNVSYERPAGVWHKLLAKWIKENRGAGPTLIHETSNQEDADESQEDAEIQQSASVAKGLISYIEREHDLRFYESEFPLFGFMRDVATNEKKQPKLYLWQGKADAIAYSRELKKYVIVEFKVVNDLVDYWKKKTDLCGMHLHQCLAYAKLLKLHMKLDVLPASLIVIIHKVTGKEGYFALFKGYPRECHEKLNEYEWFTEQPSKRPLKIVNTDKLLHETFHQYQREEEDEEQEVEVLDRHTTRLSDIFGENATVKDLLDSLGYDSLEIFDPTGTITRVV